MHSSTRMLFITIVSILNIIYFVYGDVSHLQQSGFPQQQPLPLQQQQLNQQHQQLNQQQQQLNQPQHHTEQPQVTEICLGCICEAISGCNLTLPCEDGVCGVLRIQWAYWADSGSPTLNGQRPTDPDAYKNCVSNPHCAAESVQGYMQRFGQDCNGDGVINCYDHAAIHIHGGYGCQGPLPEKYKYVFNQCLATVQHQG